MPRPSCPALRHRPLALGIASVLAAMALVAPRSTGAADRTLANPNLTWGNPLAWGPLGEPTQGDNVLIGTGAGITYAPLLFPNATFASVVIGRQFDTTDWPANNFIVTSSALDHAGFYTDQGAGSFAPVLEAGGGRNLRTSGSLAIGNGSLTQGALLLNGGRATVGGSLVAGGLSGDLSAAYVRLIASGDQQPALSVAGNLVLADGRHSEAFFQQEAGQTWVGGSLIMANQASGLGSRAFMNLAGGSLTVVADAVIGNEGIDYTFSTNAAGVRQGPARFATGRDMLLARSTGTVANYETLAGAELTVGRNLVIAENGRASFMHRAGSLVVDGMLSLGAGASGSGVLELSGSAGLALAGPLVVGAAGFGEFRHTGSTTLHLNGPVTVGRDAGAQGALALTGSARMGQGLLVGDSGQGHVGVSAGAHLEIIGDLHLGRSAGSTGSWFASASSANISGQTIVADAGFASLQVAKFTGSGDIVFGKAIGSEGWLGGDGNTLQPRLQSGGDIVMGDAGQGHIHAGLSSFELLAGRDLIFGRAASGRALTDLKAGWYRATRDIVIGDAGRAELRETTKSDLTADRDLVFGRQAGSYGSLSFSQGLISAAGQTVLGDAGVGAISVTLTPGAAPWVSVVNLVLGAQAGSEGFYGVQRGDWNIATFDATFDATTVGERLEIGRAGSGFVDLWGADHRVRGDAVLGSAAGGRGVLQVRGDARLYVGGSLSVGGPGSGQVLVDAPSAVPGSLLAIAGTLWLNSGRVDLGGGLVSAGQVQVGAAGVLNATTGHLRTGAFDVLAGGRVALNGTLRLGAGAADHGATALSLAHGAELVVPTLLLGGDALYQGGSVANLITQDIEMAGGTVVGTLLNTGVLHYGGGGLAGALLRNDGTVDLRTNLILGALDNTGRFEIGDGRQVLVGLVGGGVLTSTGVVGVAGPGSLLSAREIVLREAGQLAVTGGGSVGVTAGLSAGSPGTGVASILLDRGHLQVDAGPLVVGADGAASLHATSSSIAIGGGSDPRMHIGRQGTANLTGGTLGTATTNSPLRVQVDGGGVLRLNGVTLAGNSVVDVSGTLESNGIGIGALYPLRPRIEIAGGGQFITNTGAARDTRGTGQFFLPEIVNHGDWRKVADGTGREWGRALFLGPVVQAGTLHVESGMLELGGGATGTGTTRVGPSGGIDLVPFQSPQDSVMRYDWAGGFVNDGIVMVAGTDGVLDEALEDRGGVALASFTSSGAHGGLFLAGWKGTLAFAGGTQSFASGSAMDFWTSAGLLVSSGVIEFRGGSLDFGTGSALRASYLSLTPSRMSFLGGTIRMNAGSSIQLPHTFAIEGSNLMLSTGSAHSYGRDIALRSGAFGGSDLFVQTAGSFDWSGGRLYGPEALSLNHPVTLSISGTGLKQLDRRLVVNGAASWTGGDVAGQGTLALSGLSSFTGTAPQTFVPAVEARGRFVSRVEDGGAAQYHGRFDVLGGTVAVERGALRLSGGGSSDAGFDVWSGATLAFAGGEFVFDGANARIAGAGSASFEGGHVLLRNGARFGGLAAERLTGGTLELGASSVYSFNDGLRIEAGALLVSTGAGGFTLPRGSMLQGGALGGSDARTVATGDTFTWTGGTLGGPGATTVAPNSGLTPGGRLVIGGTDSKMLGADLLNGGVTRWQGGNIGGTATFTNADGALLDIADVCCFDAATMSPLLHNQGNMTVVGAGSPSVVLAGGLRNDGILDHQGGTLSITGRLHNLAQGTLAGGIWAVNGALRHAGGDVTVIDADVRLSSTNSSFRSVSNRDILDSFSLVTGGGRVLIGSRALTLNRNLVVDGRLEFGHGAVFNANGGSLSGSGTVQVQDFGEMNWARTNLSATGTLRVERGGRLVMSDAGSNHVHAGRTLINQGTVLWTAGDVSGGSIGTLASSITNAGLWLDDHGAVNSSINHGNALPVTTGVFTNTGTYRKSGTGTTTFLNQILDNSGRLELAEGALVLNGSGFNRAGGVIDIAAGRTLTLFGSDFRFEDGSAVTGAGVLQLVAGSSELPAATIDGRASFSNLLLAGGRVAGTHTLDGQIRWGLGALGSDGTTTIAPTATLVLENAGSNHTHAGRTLINRGTVSWNAGDVSGGSMGTLASSITNAGLWLDDHGAVNSSINHGNALPATTGVFTNTGTYRKTGTGATTFLNQILDNSGRLELAEGALVLNGSGFNRAGGVIDIAAGRTLTLSGSDFRFEDGSAVTGAGVLQLVAGSSVLPAATIDGRASFSNLLLAGGRVAGTHTLEGRIRWGLGALGSGGTTTIAPTATLVLENAGSNHVHAGRTLINQGTVLWTAGDVSGGSTGTLASSITNAGLWLDDHGAVNSSINHGNALPVTTGVFTNTGTYRKSGTGSTTFLNQILDNSGRLELAEGALVLNGSGFNRASGVIDIAAGRTLTLFGSDFRFEDGSAVTGAGVLQLVAGSSELPAATIDGRASFSNLLLAGGRVAGTHTLEGRIRWGLGALGSGGTTTIAPTATLVLENANSNHDHPGRVIINQGTVRWTSGDIRGGGGGALASGITNAGLWLDDHGTANHRIDHGNAIPETTGTFTNSGTYRKTGTGITTVFAHRLDNTGRVEVQAGRLDLQVAPAQVVGNRLAGGAWEVGPGATLVFTGVSSLPVNEGDVHLRGAGSTFAPINALADNRGVFRISDGRNFTTAGNLVNSGLLFAGAGSRLTVNGSLTSTATGMLAGSGELQVGLLTAAGAIAPGSSPGRLQLTGSLAMQDSAALEIEIAGPDAGIHHDTLHVTGAAQIAGQLRVNLLDMFAGIQGASFTILSAGSVSGQFAGLADGARFDAAGVGGSFAIDYTPTAVYLTGYMSAAPVPEPGTWVMMGAGLALMALRVRRRMAYSARPDSAW